MVTKQWMNHIEFQGKEIKYYGSQWAPQLFLLHTFLKIDFMFNRRKNLIDLEQQEGD